MLAVHVNYQLGLAPYLGPCSKYKMSPLLPFHVERYGELNHLAPQ